MNKITTDRYNEMTYFFGDVVFCNNLKMSSNSNRTPKPAPLMIKASVKCSRKIMQFNYLKSRLIDYHIQSKWP